MAGAKTKKCKNAACNCIPPEKEKFCSAHCEGIGDKTEIVCTCGHDGCVETSSTAQTYSGSVQHEGTRL